MGFDAIKKFCHNCIQISVDSFERLLNARYKNKTFNLNDNNLSEFLRLLDCGIECCSTDIIQNNKKINLYEIFDKVKFNSDTGSNDFCEIIVSNPRLINFVFLNIDKIQVDDLFVNAILRSCSNSIFSDGHLKLYLVNKSIGISQFNSLKDFWEYVYSNVNTKEGECYGGSLVNLINNNCDRYTNLC